MPAAGRERGRILHTGFASPGGITWRAIGNNARLKSPSASSPPALRVLAVVLEAPLGTGAKRLASLKGAALPLAIQLVSASDLSLGEPAGLEPHVLRASPAALAAPSASRRHRAAASSGRAAPTWRLCRNDGAVGVEPEAAERCPSAADLLLSRSRMDAPADGDDADKEDAEEVIPHLLRGASAGWASGTLDCSWLARRTPLLAA